MKLLGKKGIMRRYADNQRLAEGFDGFIFGQCKQPVGELRYGSAEKPVADVGCGVAAVYNVMRLLGKDQPVADVARDCELLRLAFFGGRFGTATKKLGRYFSYHGVSCREFRRCGEFKAALDGCKAAIVCTWNDKDHRRDPLLLHLSRRRRLFFAQFSQHRPRAAVFTLAAARRPVYYRLCFLNTAEVY